MAMSDRAYWNESVADWRRDCRLDSSILEAARARGDAPGVTVFTRSLRLCQDGLFCAVKELERLRPAPAAEGMGREVPEEESHYREVEGHSLLSEELDALDIQQALLASLDRHRNRDGESADAMNGRSQSNG